MAGRPKKYHIHLSDKEYKTLKSIIRKKDTSLTVRRRCQIILDLDEDHGKMLTYEQCYKSNGICHATVSNTVAGFAEHGIEYLTSLKRNVNSSNSRRKVDGRAEARIVELACSPAPEGHSRWTLRLLENECKVILDEPVGKDAIARALKKTNYSLIKTPTGASPKKATQNS